MKLIKTQSFELAIISKGNENSKRLALCLPGRLDTKDYACFTSHIEYLAGKGFFAVAFDPPGTWDSPGIVEFTTTNYIKVVNEIIEFFGNRPTLLLGHSRGGQVATIVGPSSPAVVGFVLVNASYGPPEPPRPEDLRDGTIVEFRDLPPGTSKTAEQKKFLLSTNYFKDGAKYDPLPALKACPKPKLLFYGTDDAFYDPEDVREIYSSLQEPKTLHELKTEHEYRYHPEVVEEVNKVMGRFIDSYL